MAMKIIGLDCLGRCE